MTVLNTRYPFKFVLTMSIISRVKWFFAQTISGYSEVTKESNPDWHMVAKKMMYDFHVFNAKICDLDSDGEKESSQSNAQKKSTVKDNYSSSVYSQDPDWKNKHLMSILTSMNLIAALKWSHHLRLGTTVTLIMSLKVRIYHLKTSKRRN